MSKLHLAPLRDKPVDFTKDHVKRWHSCEISRFNVGSRDVRDRLEAEGWQPYAVDDGIVFYRKEW